MSGTPVPPTIPGSAVFQSTQVVKQNKAQFLTGNALSSDQWKHAVHVISVSNVVNLFGLQTIDGVAIMQGNRVLLTGQTSGINNGIYYVSAQNWTRTWDLPFGSSAAGSVVYVISGTANAGKSFVCTNAFGNDVVGVNALTFATFAVVTPGALTDLAYFYGMTAGTGNGGANDYSATIPISTGAVNQGVPFPRTGPSFGTHILTPSGSNFDQISITAPGFYKISFAVSVTEAGQLGLEYCTDGVGTVWNLMAPVNSGTIATFPLTTFGRATGTSQIVGNVVLNIPSAMLIRVANTHSASALTITQIAGGTNAVGGTIIIEKIA
jgi:hypothetical protein